MLLGPFQPPKPAPGGAATVSPRDREQELLYLRVMQHKEGTLEGFTAAYGCKRLLYFEGYEDIRTAIARGKQLKGWRREKKLNLIGTINPEFKDLAQTWGWKMIIKYVPEQLLFSGFGGRKGTSSMGKISTVGVPSATLGTGSSDSAPQALWHAMNL